MAHEYDSSVEYFLNQLRIGNLPYGISNKEITAFFEPFGKIVKLFVKRRTSRDSLIFLSHPYAFIVFEKSDTADQVMAARPFYMGDCQIFLRRCLPINQKYPYEAFLTVKKMLIHLVSENCDETLPDDKSIIEYLRSAGGKIECIERIDNKTVLVQFDDYDPVDVCCLLRPHRIGNQLIEIEKFSNEDQSHLQIKLQKNLHSVDAGCSSTTTTLNMNNGTRNYGSPVPTFSIDDEIIKLRLNYKDITNSLERQHEQNVTSLSSEWELTAKDRIRLQRLTLDCKQEKERLEQENRQWQKSFSDSIREKPIVQENGELKLRETSEKTSTAAAKYDELKRNNR